MDHKIDLVPLCDCIKRNPFQPIQVGLITIEGSDCPWHMSMVIYTTRKYQIGNKYRTNNIITPRILLGLLSQYPLYYYCPTSLPSH